MRKATKKTILLIVLVLLIFPSITYAVSWWPLVPCGLNAQPKDSNGVELPKVPTQENPDAHDYTQPCNQCDLLKLLKNIIDFVLIGLMPPAAAILFVWGGFLILMGGANPKWITQGRTIFWNTAIGVAIISASWLITNTIIRSVAADNIALEWWKFQCSVTVGGGGGNEILPSTPIGGDIGTLPGGGTGLQRYGCSQNNTCVVNSSGQNTSSNCDNQCQVPVEGAVCPQSGWNLCQARPMTCSASACSQYVGAINQYAGGAASVNLLKAIMVKESSCNASADSGHAYGLMQFVPKTAIQYASRCGVQNPVQVVTAQWLKDNPALSICIASQYIQAIAQSQCGNSIRNIAAGYNGGEKGDTSSCGPSVDCKTENSCDGTTVKRWECLYDDTAQDVCNTGYNETRDYATKVLYCYNNPGF